MLVSLDAVQAAHPRSFGYGCKTGAQISMLDILNSDPGETLDLSDREKKKAYLLEYKLFNFYNIGPDDVFEAGCSPVYSDQCR